MASSLLLIKHGESQWVWDINCSQEDAFRIKRETGLGNHSFHRGILDNDPDCVQTILWLCRRQDEPALKRRDVKFDYGKFAVEDYDESDVDPTSEPSTKLTALPATVTTSPSGTNGSTPSSGTSDSPQPITTG